MTNKEIYTIARSIAHSEVTLNLNVQQSFDLRQTFSVALWQLDNSFDFGEFYKVIDAVLSEMRREWEEDQTH